MRALIVEDERLSRERLSKLITQYDPEINIAGALDSIEDTVSFLQSNEHPDLVFLDIQLADGLSFEIFQRVSLNKPVIFTTAYDQYALKAFEVNSLDYLIKPIEYKKLGQAINKFRRLQGSSDNTIAADFAKILLENQKTYKERFLVKLGRRLFYKNVSDIAYLYAEGKIVYLVEKNTNRKFIVDHTLDELAEKNLDPAKFFRINRTFILSIDSIQVIQPYTNQRLLVGLNQKHPHDLIVSRDKCTSFKAWLNY